MKGYVDESRRALINLEVGNNETDETVEITAWVDTAFDGFFVFPKTMIEELELHQEALTQAILADGSQVTFESFVCYIDWFDQVIAVQVIANDGRLPLLGTEFLTNRRLVVDYIDRTVSID